MNKEYNIRWFVVSCFLTMVLIFSYHLPYVFYASEGLLYVKTFFHEMSHAFTSTLIGGSVNEVVIHSTGGGYCLSSHALHFQHGISGLTGYFGSTIFACLIFFGERIFKNRYDEFKGFLLAFIGVSIYYSKVEWVTMSIMVSILVVFGIVFFQKSKFVETVFMKFIGIFLLVSSAMSPFILLDENVGYGDHVLVQETLGIPAVTMVYIWIVFSNIVAMTCIAIEYHSLISKEIERNGYVRTGNSKSVS